MSSFVFDLEDYEMHENYNVLFLLYCTLYINVYKGQKT